MQRIAVFGATGEAGRLITRMLLELDGLSVLACARTAEKLARLQTELDPEGSSLSTRAVDLSDGVEQIIADADLVVGATSRWQDGPFLADLAAWASTHYCGIYLSNPEKWKMLRGLDGLARDNDAMIVDDCGTHPGLPAAMIRWAAARTPLRAAWVGARFALEWNRLDVTRETVSDFLAEIEATDPSLFVDGSWKRGYGESRPFDFGDGEGPQGCMPMLMEEIREVAESGSIPSTGFFMAGFGSLMDYGVLPLSMLLAKLHRRTAENLLLWGLRHLASQPPFATLQLEGEGEGVPDGVLLRISHPDPYYITAAPVVATIRQMLAAPKPGVWTQGSCVEPNAFFDTLREMGVRVEARI